MIVAIIIIILILLFFLLIPQKKKAIEETPVAKNQAGQNPSLNLSDTFFSETDEDAIPEEIFIDDNGQKYKNINKTREIPRKTYLRGELKGKYWGVIDQLKEQEFLYSKFYDFNIYEVEVANCKDKKTPFDFPPDSNFPREKLPALLPVLLIKDGKEYAVNIHEAQIAQILFNRKLHQDEGNEVFGTITGEITGYLLDFLTEEYVERQYIYDELRPVAPKSESALIKTSSATGNVENNGNYRRTEYYYSNYKDKYWGNWTYNKPLRVAPAEGCLSSFTGILGGIIGFLFLVLLIPQIGFLLPFIILLFIFGIIPSGLWIWIFRVIGVIILIGFIYAISNSIIHPRRLYNPRPVAKDQPAESKPTFTPVVDSINAKPIPDIIISHYRSWQDYDGNIYGGKFWVRRSALNTASAFKNKIAITESSEGSYDKVIYLLKENDKENLNGIYQLFDSLRSQGRFNNKTFAELIVSFVQDIPYAVILPGACDPKLYNDDFIKRYLSSVDANCGGNQRFGINTPVEFMAGLEGDCDTRTLLLYTILSHYKYDVALLSSEYYSHSLLAINLPYQGLAYKYNDQRYVLWETTSPGIRPGLIPNEIANLNYWRISLKSK